MQRNNTNDLSTRNVRENGNIFQRTLGFVDTTITIGVFISVFVAIVVWALNKDEIQSLIIGLIVTIITLLIDIITKLKVNEKRIIEATSLGNLLSRDHELFLTVNQLVDDYLTIKSRGHELFQHRAQDALQECLNIIQGLVTGYMISDPVGKFSLGRRGKELAERTIKAVSSEPLELWRSRHWQTGLQAEADAIKRGVQVTRIFIQEQTNLSEFADVVQAHYDAGSKVYTVSPEELPAQLVHSYFIVDETILAEFFLTPDGSLRNEKISINGVEVERAIDKFNSVLRYAREYLPQ